MKTTTQLLLVSLVLAGPSSMTAAGQAAWYYHVKTGGTGGQPVQSQADPGLSSCWKSINAAFAAVKTRAMPGPWIIQVDDEATYDEAVVLSDLQTSSTETLTLTKAPWLPGRPTICTTQLAQRALAINGLWPGTGDPLPGEPGQASRRVTQVTVRGFTLKNNAAGTDQPTEQCVFSDNQSYLTEGLHIIEDCHFDGQNQVYGPRPPILIYGTCINTIFRRNTFRDFTINETNPLGVVFVVTKPVSNVVGSPQFAIADSTFYGNKGLVFECVGDADNKRDYELVFERNKLIRNSSAEHGTVVIESNALSNAVQNNIFADNTGGGGTLGIYGANNTRIYHNTFFNNRMDRELLVDLGSAAGVEVKNNLFWPTPGCLCIEVARDCTENLISANNAFFSDWRNHGSPPGSGLSTTENTEVVGWWNGSAMTTYGWNNASKNNTGNGYTLGGPGLDKNLRLVAGSLCIDRGVSGLVSNDFGGGHRPVGGGYDIGADEYGTKGPEGSLGGKREPELEGQHLVLDAPMPMQQRPGDLPEGVDPTTSQTGRTSVEKEPGTERNRPTASAPKAGEVMTNSIGMKLVSIPAGEFMMGSASPEELARKYGSNYFNFKNEQPRHRVRISRGFWMGCYEVTKGQFDQFVRETGHVTSAEKRGAGYGMTKDDWDMVPGLSWRSPGFEQTSQHPVVLVDWEDSLAFCQWLSRKEGATYRLPTEAEWEYACRGGSGGDFSWGSSLEGAQAYANMMDAAAERWLKQFGVTCTNRLGADDGYSNTAPVGLFRPNKFGLYDMHGNVAEWCQDRVGFAIGSSYYDRSPETDPPGPFSGTMRVFRGGSWADEPGDCRSAWRGGGTPVFGWSKVGFRVVLTTDPSPRRQNQQTERPGSNPRYYHVKTGGTGGQPVQSEADPGLSSCWNSINAAFAAVTTRAMPGPWIIQVDGEATYDEAVVLSDLQSSPAPTDPVEIPVFSAFPGSVSGRARSLRCILGQIRA